MGIFRFFQNNPHFIWLIIVIGAPIVRGIVKKLGEQAAERNRLIEREREQIDGLRTGRVAEVAQGSNTPANSARQALEELAAKRRAELTQGRVQSGTTQSAGAPSSMSAAPPRQVVRPETVASHDFRGAVNPPSPPSIQRAPAPATPLSRNPGRSSSQQQQRPQRPYSPQQTPPRQRQPQLANQQYQQPTANRAPKPTRRQARPEVPSDLVAPPPVPSAAPPAPSRRVEQPSAAAARTDPYRIATAGVSGAALLTLPRSAWRQAFILQEVLMPPIGLRKSSTSETL